MSIFITFEGGEGSGKSYQSRALYRRLNQIAIPTVLTHEPGGTPFGNRISLWLKWAREKNISPLTELLLFNSSRAQLINEVILPSLKADKIVICDRFTDSTIAYQSYGRGLSIELVEQINHMATQGVSPDLTIFLDLPVEEGFKRKLGKKKDRFEQESLAFHNRVRAGYHKLAENRPEQWFIVDSLLPRARAREVIWQRVERLISSKGA